MADDELVTRIRQSGRNDPFLPSLFAIICPIGAVLFRESTGAWTSLMFLIPNTIAVALHCLVVFVSFRNNPNRKIFTLSKVATILFVMAIALQTDFGDTQHFYAFQRIYSSYPTVNNLPSWWPLSLTNEGDWFEDLLFFVPVVVVWFMMMHDWHARSNAK